MEKVPKKVNCPPFSKKNRTSHNNFHTVPHCQRLLKFKTPPPPSILSHCSFLNVLCPITKTPCAGIALNIWQAHPD